MEFLSILAIAIGLAMDVFAVSLGIGTTGQAATLRPRLRLAFHTGLFQGGMTLLGWLAGATIASLIDSLDHWVAFGLLTFVGVRMIRSGLQPNGECYNGDPTRGSTLIMICIATSIDAAAVGLSFAMLAVDIASASLIIGLASFALGSAGLFLGDRLGKKFGKRMEILGGLLLIGIGVRILITHLA